MANNCLVTKLKGVVSNPDIARLGEVRIISKSDGTSMWGNVLELNLSSPIHYEVHSGITALRTVNFNLETVQNLPLSGTISYTGIVYIIATGEGVLKLWDRQSLNNIVVRANYDFDDIDAFRMAYMNDNFSMRVEGPHIVDELSYPTSFYSTTNSFVLPVIQNLDYGNYIAKNADENSTLYLNFFLQGGRNFNLHGDIVNITNANVHIDNISFWDNNPNHNFYVSDFSKMTPLCKDTCTQFIIIGNNPALTGEPSAISTWKKLISINFQCSNPNFEWKPVFDAWNAMADYRGRNVEIWVNGLYNGNPINNLHHVIFDPSSSNYTVTA